MADYTSTAIFVTAVILLLHSAYSAHEFSYFVKHFPSSTLSKSELPLDVRIFVCLTTYYIANIWKQIKLEASIGAIVAVLGAIYKQSDKLKPIKFSKAVVSAEVAGERYLRL